MEALVTVLLVIGGLVAIGAILGFASEALEKSTGKDLGTWFWTLVNTIILLGIGYGGLSFLRWGMADPQNSLVVFVGLAVMGLAGFMIYLIWTDDGRPGYNPMRGKRAHYSKEGKLTGYSDKE